MKANEFIRNYGLFTFLKSTRFLNSRKYLVVYADEIDFTDEIKPCHGKLVFDRKEVKRLIKSHELVEKYSAYNNPRWHFIADYCYKMKVSPFSNHNYDCAGKIYDDAIADVESCL